jgi:hypothetical protein
MIESIQGTQSGSSVPNTIPHTMTDGDQFNTNNTNSSHPKLKMKNKKKKQQKINTYITHSARQQLRANINVSQNTSTQLNAYLNNTESTQDPRSNDRNINEANNSNIIQHNINDDLFDNPITLPIDSTTRSNTGSQPLINDTKGDSLDYKTDNHLRFMFQNINSLCPQTLDKWAATTRQIFQFWADIVGFCETCTNWSKRDLKKQFQITANKSLKNPIISTTTTTLKLDGNYVPGGCCQVTANSWTTRHEAPIYDAYRHGRWVGNTYRLSATKQLHIVSAYRVCEQSPNATNSLSTSTQQYTMLTARGIEQLNPRQQFVDDFISQFQEMCDNSDNYFILALDANATLGQDKEGIDRLANECNLIDMYSTIHQDYTEFPTHQRGSKRIDYILCSRNIIPYVSQCGYVRFNDAFDSDHRAIFCDISHEIMTDITELRDKRKRIIGSNSTNKEGERYIRHLYRNLFNNGVFQKVEQILQDITNNNYEQEDMIHQVNSLDSQITKLMLQAEDNTVCVKDMTLWSPILAQSNLIIQYWLITIKGARQKTNVRKRLSKIVEKMTEESKTHIRSTTSSVTRALRISIKNHNVLVKNHKLLTKQYLQQLANDHNERDNTQGKVQVDDLIKREQRRQDFAIVRNLLRKKKSKGLTMIEVPSVTNIQRTGVVVETD